MIALAVAVALLVPVPPGQAAVPGALAGMTGGNQITAENALAGTPGWQITKRASGLEIAGYITRPSVVSGQTVPVRVNAKGSEADQTYKVEVFRMGYYGGVGARRVAGPHTYTAGAARADPVQVDATTGRVEADWPVGFTIDTTGFTTGAFLVRLTSHGGWQAYVPFTVRSATAEPYMFLQSHLTWQAYNTVGGNSLYQWNSAYPGLRKAWCIFWFCQWIWTDPATGRTEYSSERPPAKPRAHQVGFRRPYEVPGRMSEGSGEYLPFEHPLVMWLEKQGFDLGYAADFDLHENRVPSGVRALVLPGHQEYWTGAMRDNAEEAQARGVGLVSFGANQAYWRCRIEGSAPSDAGVLTCYKADNGEPHPDDPLKNDPALASAQFRSTFVARPEQTLLGSMFTGWIRAGVPSPHDPGTSSFGWVSMVASSDVSDPLFAGTGIGPQEGFTALNGGEFDRVDPSYPSIPGTRKLFSTSVEPFHWNGGGNLLQMFLCVLRWPGACWYGTHDATVAEKVTGGETARVFNAGTFNWQWGLSDFTLGSQSFDFANPEIQALTTNIMLWAAKYT